jgi:cation:H+ antiporter
MTILTSIGLVLVGITLLTLGGEVLVKGAIALAQVARVRPAVIGLTVVSFGTSVPELVVSVMAAASGNTELALANVIGSNILNVALIVGLSAVIASLPVHGSALKIEWPFMFGASVLVVAMGFFHQLTRAEGIVLLLLLVFFNWWVVHRSRTQIGDEERAEFDKGLSHIARRSITRSAIINVLLIVLGVAVLTVGSRLLVNGAITLARLASVSERIIGLTVVAMGTSMPELATSLVAARRGHTDLAVANVIGSNIFNILGVLGAVAVVQEVQVTAAAELDMLWMLGFSVALLPMMFNRKISRREGAALLTGWAVYIVWVLRQPLNL